MRIKLDIMYDGTSFCGWQIQPKGRSIQGEITAAAKRLFGEDINLVGSGRTDAGVHALGQVAHFDLTKDFDIAKITAGLNFYLPPAIRVQNAAQAMDGFSARHSAKSKTYFYLLYQAQSTNPLFEGRALRVCDCDFSAMESAAGLFVGSHDFAPFMSSGSSIKTTVRTVTHSKIYKKEPFFVFEISANGFLYNMVRKIMGVLLAVGAGKKTAEEIAQALAQGVKVKEIAPPQALYLAKVEY